MSFLGKSVAFSATQPTISRITIHATDIFDLESNVALRKFPYTTINFLHIQTRNDVIMRELLFKVGDQLDPFLLKETERNLRALSFIRSARVATFPQRDGTVALVVFTNDSWTTEPILNLDGNNGIDTFEVGFKEKNLFGLGKNIEFLYKDGSNFTEHIYQYKDPRLFNSRWQLDAEYINLTDGEERDISVVRPFFSADTKWSARGSHHYRSENFVEFEDGKEVSTYQQTRQVEEVGAAVKVGSGRNVVNHAGFRYQFENTSYSAIDKTNPTKQLPENREAQIMFLDLDSQRSDFVELTHIDKMNRIEDFNLGPSLQASPGISPESLAGKESESRLNGSLEKRWMIRSEHLLWNKIVYSGRNTFHKAENQKMELAGRYYHRFSPRQTLVFNGRAEWGLDLDDDNLIELGGENGLRAYEEEEFIGTKSLLFNVEDRFYFIDEVWNLFALGAAVFYDSGYAWPQGQTITASDLRHDFGAGLRIGLTRSSNEVVVRVDISYRSVRPEGDDSKFVFTFGTGQAF